MPTTVQTGQALSQAAAAAAPVKPVAAPVVKTNGVASNPTPSISTTTSYPVVTSQPATSNFNNIQNTYATKIQPNIQNASANSQANNNLPVIDGYNVSATPTGNTGESKVSQNGLTYYITPQQPAATANDIKSILSSGDLSQTNENNGTNGETTTGNNTSTNSTTGTTGNSSVNGILGQENTETQNYTSQLNQNTDALTQAAQTFGSTVSSIMSGSFPLSSAQQALVDATNQAFGAMQSQANLKAAALSSETGGIANKINATAGELLNINSIQAASIAKLEIGFENQDYQAVNDAYKAYTDAETAKTTALTDSHNAVMKTYSDALSAVASQQAEADKQAEMAQTAKMDAQTIADDKINEGIDQEKANIEQETYNQQYGSVTNGSLATPQANGASIIIAPDSYKGNTTVVNGVPVVSKADAPIVSAAMNASALLAKIQGELNQIKSNPESDGLPNGTLVTQYAADVQSLNGILGTLSSTDPSFAGSLSGKTLSTNPSGATTPAMFSNIQSAINSGLTNKLPGYTPPPLGQVFKDETGLQNYFSSIGAQAQYTSMFNTAQAQYTKQGGTGAMPQSYFLGIVNGQSQ